MNKNVARWVVLLAICPACLIAQETLEPQGPQEQNAVLFDDPVLSATLHELQHAVADTPAMVMLNDASFESSASADIVLDESVNVASAEALGSDAVGLFLDKPLSEVAWNDRLVDYVQNAIVVASLQMSAIIAIALMIAMVVWVQLRNRMTTIERDFSPEHNYGW